MGSWRKHGRPIIGSPIGNIGGVGVERGGSGKGKVGKGKVGCAELGWTGQGWAPDRILKRSSCSRTAYSPYSFLG